MKATEGQLGLQQVVENSKDVSEWWLVPGRHDASNMERRMETHRMATSFPSWWWQRKQEQAGTA